MSSKITDAYMVGDTVNILEPTMFNRQALTCTVLAIHDEWLWVIGGAHPMTITVSDILSETYADLLTELEEKESSKLLLQEDINHLKDKIFKTK